jgi:hypothetical protein
MKTNLFPALFLALLSILIATGCATTGANQNAGRKIKFAAAIDTNGDGIPDTAGTMTLTREFDPATGLILRETTTLTHALAVTERDKSRLGAKGLLSIQAVANFEHSRTGYTGSSSSSAAKSYNADPDEAAIGEAGKATGSVIGEAVKAATR